MLSHSLKHPGYCSLPLVVLITTCHARPRSPPRRPRHRMVPCKTRASVPLPWLGARPPGDINNPRCPGELVAHVIATSCCSSFPGSFPALRLRSSSGLGVSYFEGWCKSCGTYARHPERQQVSLFPLAAESQRLSPPAVFGSVEARIRPCWRLSHNPLHIRCFVVSCTVHTPAGGGS